MKVYVRSASTLQEVSDLIRSRLKVDGVKSVELYKIGSRGATVRLFYDDGSTSRSFTVKFDNKPNRHQADTKWNPNWSIEDDGSVIDSDGSLVGWFKLSKSKPTQTSANYLEDSLVVEYGTNSIELTDTSGEQVAKAVRKRS